MNTAGMPPFETGGFPARRMAGQATANRANGADLVALAIAALLLFAGTLKAAGPWTSGNWGGWQVAAGLLELALAVWLISGTMRRPCWRVSVGVFGVFACYNLAQGLAGTGSCGCFGAVAVSPWWALLMDSMALAGLVLTGRSWTASGGLRPGVPAALGVCGAALVISLSAGRWPPWTGIPPQMRVDPPVVEIAVDYMAGFEKTFRLELSNPGRLPIRLVGWNSSCGICRIDGFTPCEIAPGGKITAELVCRRPGFPREVVAEELHEQFATGAKALEFKGFSQIWLLGSWQGFPAATVTVIERIDPDFVRQFYDDLPATEPVSLKGEFP